MTEGSESVKATFNRKRKFVYDYKAERGCMDCGERDPWVLELDHRDPSTKNMKNFPSAKDYRRYMSWHSLSWSRLVEELEKCDVVCANCHRRRTAVQQGWARY